MVLLPLLLHSLAAAPELARSLEPFVPDLAARTALEAEISARVEHGAARLGGLADRQELASFLEAAIAHNLAEKHARSTSAGAFPLDAERLMRTVVEYELFKAQAYLGSGVFPKRYFGYFDERWDTAAEEQRMRRTIIAAVEEVNLLLGARKAPIRITDQEVAVTFIAEGGALLLADASQDREHIHPVLGIGLDDIATGFLREQALVERLDHRLGTGLQAIVVRGPQGPQLARFMRFEEAILGTAVMWVFEKGLAAEKLMKAEGRRLSELPPPEQFIFGSLVYNSGLIFSTPRMRQIRDFSAADYLEQVSRQNQKGRGLLPLFKPKEAAELLIVEDRYPVQLTSWSAVYHVLQRYGGYAALSRFTEVFDPQGMYRAR